MLAWYMPSVCVCHTLVLYQNVTRVIFSSVECRY